MEESISEAGIPQTDEVETSQSDQGTSETDTSQTETMEEGESTTEPAGTDESTTEPVRTNESTTEPAGTDESTTEPAGTDESTTEPAGTDTSGTDTAETSETEESEGTTEETVTEETTEEETTGEGTTEEETTIETTEEVPDEEGVAEEWKEVMATATDTNARGINLNVGGEIAGIINPGRAASGVTNSPWGGGTGCYIYYGNYYQKNSSTTEPVRYRVLYKDNSSTGKGNADSILLWSGQIMDVIPYDEKQEYRTGTDIWTNSLVRKWLNAETFNDYKEDLNSEYGCKYTHNGYLGTAFSIAERSYIKETQKEEETGDYGGTVNFYSCGLKNDRIFLLSVGELENEAYGFAMQVPASNIKSRYGGHTQYARDQELIYLSANVGGSWLRTSCKDSNGNYGSAVVRTQGNISDGGDFNKGLTKLNEKGYGVAPAFNLDRSKILFTLEATEYATVDKEKYELSKVEGTDSNSWQLTMLDTSNKFQINGEVVRDGKTITVPYEYWYTGSADTKATQISIMMTDRRYDRDGKQDEQDVQGVQVLYYGRGRIKGDKSLENGSEVQFDLPSDFDYKGSDWYTYIFAEQVNGFQQTDFASDMSEILPGTLNLPAIDSIAITDIEAPVGGKALDMDAVCTAKGIIEASGQLPVSWNPLAQTAGFGEVYRAEVSLTAMDGYRFVDTVSATINGEEAELTYDAETGILTIGYTFPRTADAKLLKIPDPEDIELPNGVALGDLKTALANKKFIPIETEDENVNIADVTWQTDSITTNSYNPDKKTGQTITVQGTITLPDRIDRNNQSLIVRVKVVIQAAVAAAFRIDPAPYGGQPLPATAECGTKGIEDKNPDIKWTPAHSTADFNTEYTAEIKVNTSEEFNFEDGTIATVNGKEAETEYDPATGIMTVSYKFRTDKAKLLEIPGLEAVEVPNGTTRENLKKELDKINEIPIRTEDKNISKAEVRWSAVTAGKYDPLVKTRQEFEITGSVILPEGIDRNGESTTVTVRVIVAAAVSVALRIPDLVVGQPLPETAECKTEGIVESSPEIAWSPSDTTVGFNTVYTAVVRVTGSTEFNYVEGTTATVNGKSAVTNYNSVTRVMTIRYEFPPTAKAKLLEIPRPDDLEVPNGTTLDSLRRTLNNLRDISIRTEDEGVSQAQVQWDTVTAGSYDPETKTEQTFTVNGTVTLPDKIDQNNVSTNVQLTVIVAAAEAMALRIAELAGGQAMPERAECLTDGIVESNPVIVWSPSDRTAGFNTVYTAVVRVTASADFNYVAGTKATVNGKSAQTEYDSETRVLTVSYVFPATARARLIRIPEPDAVENVLNGSEKTAAGLGLPEKIRIETEDKNVNEAGVTWDLENLAEGTYDPLIKTEQVFKVNGRVQLPEEIVNPGEVPLDVRIAVRVAAEGAFFIEIDKARELNPVSPETVGYATVTVKKTSMVYTGAELRPAVSVKYTYLEYGDDGVKGRKKQKTLKENVDYTITYKNNIHVRGSEAANAPSIILNGIGDFAGAIKKTFTITPKSIKNVTIDPIGDVIYSGWDQSGAVRNSIIVRDGNNVLDPERDYTVTFCMGKNGNVPSPSVIGNYLVDTQMCAVIVAKSTGDYTGTAKKKTAFYIRGNSWNRTDLSYAIGLEASFKKNLIEKPLIYNGKPQKPALNIKLNGKKLATKNYSLIYQNNVNAGTNTASVTIVGKNQCYGKKTIYFSIQPKDFSKVTVKSLAQIYYRNSASDLRPLVKEGSKILVQGEDYTVDVDEVKSVQFFGSKLPVLVVTLKPTPGNTNYIQNSMKQVKVKVTKRSLTNRFNTRIVVKDVVLTADAQVTGAIPEVTVSYNGEVLTKDVDYTLAYKKNKKIGNAQVVITGKGAYSGKRTIKFRILSP